MKSKANELIDSSKYTMGAEDNGNFIVSASVAESAIEIARQEERERLQKYINQMADTISNELMWADGLTTGNYSHIAPAMKGAALRRLEQMVKGGIIEAEVYGPINDDIINHQTVIDSSRRATIHAGIPRLE